MLAFEPQSGDAYGICIRYACCECVQLLAVLMSDPGFVLHIWWSGGMVRQASGGVLHIAE